MRVYTSAHTHLDELVHLWDYEKADALAGADAAHPECALDIIAEHLCVPVCVLCAPVYSLLVRVRVQASQTIDC